MAEEFINELYENAEVLFRVKQMISSCRKDQVFLFMQQWERLQETMASFCRQITMQNETMGEKIWDGFVEARRLMMCNDFVAVADWLEKMIPILYDAMGVFGNIDVEEGEYRFYSSQSGYLCIVNKEKKKSLNSGLNPAWESYEKAKAIYHPWQKQFCTLGCGLGYLCWQMYEVSGNSLDIYIYDIDNTMVNYAKQFGVLDKIPEGQLHVVIESDPRKLVSLFSKKIEAYNAGIACLNIESESLDKMGSCRECLNDMLSTFASSRNLFHLVERNYYRNTYAVKRYVTELKWKKNTKTWIVVGGGPSVDEYLDYLRECVGEKGIIAATTVYQKLINEGVKPDFMVAIDPQNRTYGHLHGVTDYSVPLLMTDAANWQFGEKYCGDKYLIPTSGFPFSEDVYKAKGMKVWEAEGTVPGMCIEMAIYLGAKEIELIGVDLAYAVGHTHAKGTMDDKEISVEGLKKVKSVTGGEVYTSAVFAEYIADMEDQISRHKNVKFYNLSKNGAYIQGANRKRIQD